MKTNKEKLLRFLELKNHEILKKTGLMYVTKKDMNEVKGWNEETCRRIVNDMNGSDDVDNCAWCLIQEFQSCQECEYGKRNGVCGDGGSRYRKIFNRLKGEISSTINIHELMKQTGIE